MYIEEFVIQAVYFDISDTFQFNVATMGERRKFENR